MSTLPGYRQTFGSSGAALAQLGVEHHRELLWYGGDSCTDLADRDADMAGRYSVARCYRIVCGTRPVAYVRESFPLGGPGEDQWP